MAISLALLYIAKHIAGIYRKRFLGKRLLGKSCVDVNRGYKNTNPELPTDRL